jgi:hypothetical protein
VLPGIAADLLLTDPPYGIGYVQGGGRGSAGKSAFCGVPVVGDEAAFDPEPFLRFPDVVLWGANYYSDRLPAGRWFVLDKRCGVTPSRDQADCELAWVSSGQASRVFRHVWDGMIRDSEPGPRVHPTQKPVALMLWCLAQFPAARVVLDPFAGSGTTLRAAKDLGRKAIGIEIEERYCEIAARRMAQEVLALA